MMIGRRARHLVWMIAVVALLGSFGCGPRATGPKVQMFCEQTPEGELEGSVSGYPSAGSRPARDIGVGATLYVELMESASSDFGPPGCGGGETINYESVESSDPDVLAVENTALGKSTAELVGKKPGEATITVTEQDGSSFNQTFRVVEIARASLEVLRNPYLDYLSREESGSMQPPETLALLPDSRLRVQVEPRDADGNALLGDLDVGVAVDGGATVISADSLDYTATIKAPSEAGSFEITTNIGGSRTVDVVSMEDIDHIELFGRTSFSDFHGPIQSGETFDSDLYAPDFDLQILPTTGSGRYVHGAAGGSRVTVELLEGDEEFILPESDEYGFDGKTETPEREYSLDFKLYLEEGKGGEAKIRLAWKGHELTFDIVTAEAKG